MANRIVVLEGASRSPRAYFSHLREHAVELPHGPSGGAEHWAQAALGLGGEKLKAEARCRGKARPSGDRARARLFPRARGRAGLHRTLNVDIGGLIVEF